MDEQPIEIQLMSLELQKLANSGALAPDTTRACRQAANLLVRMREIILCEVDPAIAQEQLRWIMVQQGEG